MPLDGHAGAVGLHGNQIDAVAPVEPRQPLPVRPFPPRPNPRHVELGVVAHRRHEQVLEPTPLLRFAGRIAANAGKHIPHPLAGAKIEGGLAGGHELVRAGADAER